MKKPTEESIKETTEETIKELTYMDMLVKLGVGNAHPGGFAATLEQLEHFPLPPGSRVLEVGCGTGRTACHLASLGCDVTGVDLRDGMIEKAKHRAHSEKQQVHFVQGDVCALPFGSEQFDYVLAESVTNFVDTPAALSEYYRVLKPNGTLYDREIIALKTLTDEVESAINEYYGVKTLRSADEWIQLTEAANFRNAHIWKPLEFSSDLWKAELMHPDALQQADKNAYEDPRIWQMAQRYEEIMNSYRDYFGFGVLIGQK